MRALALVALLANSACAPTYRIATKRCPTTASYLGDFGLTATSLALSAIAYNKGDTPRTVIYATFSMGLALADNIAGHRCVSW